MFRKRSKWCCDQYFLLVITFTICLISSSPPLPLKIKVNLVIIILILAVLIYWIYTRYLSAPISLLNCHLKNHCIVALFSVTPILYILPMLLFLVLFMLYFGGLLFLSWLIPEKFHLILFWSPLRRKSVYVCMFNVYTFSLFVFVFLGQE